jgi:hypothetical protein
MSKRKRSAPANGASEHASQSPELPLGRAWFLEQHQTGFVTIQNMIATARKRIAKKPDSGASGELDAFAEIVGIQMPQTIRRLSPVSVTNGNQINAAGGLCETMTQLAQDAKLAIPRDRFRIIQQAVHRQLSDVQQVVLAKLVEIADAPADNQPTPFVPHWEEEHFEAPEETPEEPTTPLSPLEEAYALVDVHNEAERTSFIGEKLVALLYNKYWDFLTQISGAPINLSQQVTADTINNLAKVCTALMTHIGKVCANAHPLDLQNVKQALQQPPALEKFSLPPAIQEALIAMVIEPLQECMDGVSDDEEMVFMLSEQKDHIRYDNIDDIQTVILWKKVEQGDGFPLQKYELDYIESKMPSKHRMKKKLLNDEKSCAGMALHINTKYHGGFSLRSAEHIHTAISAALTATNKAQPADVSKKTVVAPVAEPAVVQKEKKVVVPVIVEGEEERVVEPSVVEKVVEPSVVEKVVEPVVVKQKKRPAAAPAVAQKKPTAAVAIQDPSSAVISQDSAADISVEIHHVPSGTPSQQERNIAITMVRVCRSVDDTLAKRVRMSVNIKRSQNKLSHRDEAFTQRLINEALTTLDRADEIPTPPLKPVDEELVREESPVIAEPVVQHPVIEEVPVVETSVVDAPDIIRTVDDDTHLAVLDIAMRARAAMIEEWTEVQSSLIRISQGIDTLDDKLIGIEEQADALGTTLGNLCAALFSAETVKLYNHCILDINTGEFKTSPREEVEQSAATLKNALARLQVFQDLQAEVETMREAINALHNDYQKLSGSVQNVKRFHNEVTKVTFGVCMQEFLPDEDRDRIQEIPEFLQAFNAANREIGLVDQGHIRGMEQSIEEAGTGIKFTEEELKRDKMKPKNDKQSPVQLEQIFTESLQILEAFLNPSAKKQSKKKSSPKPSSNGKHSAEDLPELQLSQLQYALVRILTAQTGARHPRHSTWGSTASTIRTAWIETFGDEEDSPTEDEITEALSDTQLTGGVPEKVMTYRPKNEEMGELRRASQYISLWGNQRHHMFLPTHQLYDYAEQGEITLEGDELERLQVHRNGLKEKRKKTKWKKKAKREVKK